MGTEVSATAARILDRCARRTLDYDFTVWFWGDAIAIDGLLDSAELGYSQDAVNHCRRFAEAWSARELSWVDHLTPGAAVLRLAQLSGDTRLLDAALRLADWLTNVVPRTASGYPLFRPDLPEYRHTVWVDTLYHEPVFFSQLANVTGDADWHNHAVASFNAHVSALTVGDGPLLAHALDSGAGILRGPGWGRGNGWAILGAIDLLDWLPREHPQYAAIYAWIERIADRLAELQDPSGFLHTLLTDLESYLEASTASFVAAAFYKGMRTGLLDRRFTEHADLAWQAAQSRVGPDGGFWGVSACTYAATAPGDDRSIYRTLPTEVNVWGQGSILRAAAERLLFERGESA